MGRPFLCQGESEPEFIPKLFVKHTIPAATGRNPCLHLFENSSKIKERLFFEESVKIRGADSFSPKLNMNELVTEVIKSLEFRIRAQGFAIETADLPPCQGDPVQVQQLFSNLLDNALKYHEQGMPGRIRISGTEEGPQVSCLPAGKDIY